MRKNSFQHNKSR